MKHTTTPAFRRCLERLPDNVQALARKNFELLKRSPGHPSLHFKRIEGYLSVRVGLYYRALGVASESTAVWFWIGTHAEYDQMVG